MRIERGRQFAGDAGGPLLLFDDKGGLGGYLPAAAKKIAGQEISVSLQLEGGALLTLKSEDEWTRFFADHAATRDATKKFGDKFGISFRGFVDVVDDLAASDDRNIALDLSPQSAISDALSLVGEQDVYALKLAKGATIDLAGPNAPKAEAAGVPSIGPDILAVPIAGNNQRDRREQESWGDFVVTNKSWRAFRDNTGAAPFAKLHKPDWKDAEAMALCERFNLPLHLEVRPEKGPNGEVQFQDKSEMFREIYFGDADGVLQKHGISVRLRIRFDFEKDPANPDGPEKMVVRRTLIQVKDDRQIDPVSGKSSAHKTEERYWSDVQEVDVMQTLLNGKDKNGRVVGVMQKLYKLLQDLNALPADGLLKLQPESLVLQKRRRTHLQLDDVNTVKLRLDAAVKDRDALTAAAQPVPEALSKWITKLEFQHKTMSDATTLLKKYGQWFPTGETMILSADRFNVYDPHSRKALPTELDDELGRVGRGLHTEAEWDSASSDPYEKALAEIEKRLAANPAPDAAAKDVLNADHKAIEVIRDIFRADAESSEDIQTERLLAAGLEHDPSKKSKEERAHDMIAARPNQARYWHSA